VLEATRGSGMEISGGAGNRIVGCLLRNLGNLGVVITGGTNHGVVSCDVFDTGDVRSAGQLRDDGSETSRIGGGRFPVAQGIARVEARLPAHPIRPDRPASGR
jgi:hypothetical protein